MNSFSFLNNKKILITGASGVIGSNLAKSIRLSSNCEIFLNYLSDIAEDFKNNSFALNRFDITDLDAIEKLPMFDVIFHCAGYGQPQKFCANPEKTFSLNTLSTQKLSEKVIDGGKFIFMSSSEVYSGSELTTEDSPITISPRNSRNCYILSKLFGEFILSFNSRIEAKSLRICLCYGKGFKEDDKRVLSEFINKARSGDIQLMDDGSAIRRYIHIDDCITAIANITKSSEKNLYNIGGSEKTTIKEIAQIVADVFGRKIKLGDPNNSLKDSPKDVIVSIERYEKEFGQLNTIPLYEGVKNLAHDSQ
jgi:nucleoside-diphosphate-sugar epimerase